MLTSLTLDNFRAFASESVALRRLNIFVGPNNSGKSSIVSAINLIAQNVKRGTQEFSLALNGPYAELGTFYDVVHGHSARSSLSISFEIGALRYSYRYRYSSQRREIILTRAEIRNDDLIYEYTNRDAPKERLYQLGNQDLNLLDSTRGRARFYGFLALLPLSNAYSPGLDLSNKRIADARDLMYRSSVVLERHFARFDYVGAFRSFPERTYLYTGEAHTSVGRFGQNFAQMLASSSSRRTRSSFSTMKRTAEWFVEAGISRNVSINPLTSRHFEIQVQDHTGALNNIVDSGFGCSQVLPVIVGGYNLLSTKRVLNPPAFVVQEPEIHLHPSAAAHLGTFFVELAQSRIQCFVETHSENIVLRVARHVAQGDIRPEDVAIYWVSGNDGKNEAKLMEILPDGTFSTEWPEGFFPTRSNETVQLARAATKYRSNMGVERQ